MSENAMGLPPEKSNFSRRCNLLSQYLKKNRNFGGINLGLTRKPDSDLGFTGKPDSSGQQNATAMPEALEIKPILLTQKLSAVPSVSSGGKAKDANFISVPDSSTSQLTIFFGGKVAVFNKFPTDKAKEIMEVAKLANPGTFPTVAVVPESVAADNRKNGHKDNSNSNSSSNNSSKSDVVIPDLNEPTSSGNTNNQELVERIAWRASLHRFFAKRKDRAMARAPYQVTASPWLEQGQPSGHAAALLEPNGRKDEPEKEEGEEVQCLKDLELKL